MGGTYKVYPTASSINEDIEQGDGGTHEEITARRIGGLQGEGTAKRSGDTHGRSEEAPGVEQEPREARKYSTRATRAQLETMRATQDRERTQHKREDDTPQPVDKRSPPWSTAWERNVEAAARTREWLPSTKLWRLLSPKMHKAFLIRRFKSVRGNFSIFFFSPSLYRERDTLANKNKIKRQEIIRKRRRNEPE